MNDPRWPYIVMFTLFGISIGAIIWSTLPGWLILACFEGPMLIVVLVLGIIGRRGRREQVK